MIILQISAPDGVDRIQVRTREDTDGHPTHFTFAARSRRRGQIEDLHSITRIDAVPAERLQALVVVALEARKGRESGSLEFRRGLPPVCADTPNARTLADTEMSVSREHGTRIGLPEHPDSGRRPALVPTL